MPRSTYGDRSTVSILRGSNLDQAAAANLAAAVRLAHADGDLEDDEDEDEAEFEEEDHANLLASGLVPGAPVHVFDADAPEHVCLDLPSPLVDICPLGPAGGPATGVLILCEEELVAVDLLTPGWPLLTLPYLSCLHTSAISAYSLFTQVNPAFLERLDAVAECGKGDALGLGRRETGYSKRPWPVQGGQCILPGSGSPSRGDLSIDPAHSLVTSTDLLVTGHENGTVAFWRLGPGGCARKVFTLYTGSLFDGEFGPDAGGDSRRDGDDENDPWPPFRRAGLFDPFMDDPRAAVKCIQLVENTLVVGGAAGQVTVWQFADERPVVRTVDVPIVQEIPGFRWKGHAPLKLRPQGPSRSPGMSLYPVGIALAQPPAQITSLAVCELPTTTTTTAPAPAGAPSEPAKPGVVVVGFGTPHGFGLVHWASQPSDLTSTAAAAIAAGNADSSPGLILAQSTIPFNSEALEEAAVGEGWARRRTRELKNSLRDSFRRLKRMRSTSSIRRAPSNASASSSTTAPVAPVARPPASHMSARVGLRRSVTQSRPAVMQVSGDPLQEAIQRSQPHSDAAAATDLPMPSGGEREICDRPVETASTAVVRCVAFGPALHRIRAPAGTPVLLGSFFVSTSGGATNVYALFADRAHQPSQLAVRHASELILHHRAPVIALRLIDTKTYIPFSPNSIGGSSPASSNSPPPPHLVIVSEEQVRLFSLPSLHLRHKVRITAKDGFRIKAASIVTFQQTPQFDGCFDKMAGALGDGTTTSQHQPSQPIGLVRGNLGPEFGLVFTNNGGQAVVLSIPYLRRRDAIPLLGPQDLLAVNSVAFVTNGSASCTALPPSLGVYQLAHGQLTLFDVVLAGQKASAHGLAYRALYRIRPITDLAEQDSPANRVASMPSPRAGRTNNVSAAYLSARNTAGSPLSTRSGQTGSDVANQSGSSPGQNR
nr:unnamed protein product [Spirometra erinaceieuropaei]